MAIFTSRKRQGSDHWMYPKMIVNTPNCSEGNPVLFGDAKGDVWLFYVTMYGDRWTECKIYFLKSETMGRTWEREWSSPRRVGVDDAQQTALPL